MSRISWWLLAFWIVAVIGMAGRLVVYGATPGNRAASPAAWPDNAPLPRDADRWTLVVFAHPHCPCTMATMAELARFHVRYRNRIRVTVVLYHPPDEDAAWTDGPVRKAAARLDGVTVATDPDGRWAHRFGARTSGHLLAYDPRGALGFSGGLTTSRGHEGLSDGSMVLGEMIRSNQAAGVETHDVFGCAIVAERGDCGGEACAP